MKITLNDCINRINHALNYPSVTYDDIFNYFDMAIMELNTTLHIALPSVSEMREIHSRAVAGKPNLVILDTLPSSADTIDVKAGIDLATPEDRFFFDSSRGQYAVKDPEGIWRHYDELIGVCNDMGNPTYFKALKLGMYNAPFWANGRDEDPQNVDMTMWLPDDWIMLYLIPYVCFKYACRDGGTASTFAEEMQQGFQQLQDMYSVPSSISLNKAAGCLAYVDDIRNHMPELRVEVPVKAITKDMIHPREVIAQNSGIFDRGGFLND